MELKINRKNAVPIVITEKYIKRMPKVRNERKYLGIKTGLYKMFIRLGIRIIDFIEENMFEDGYIVDDEGEIEEKHIAVHLTEEDNRYFLDCTEINYKPACGVHIETAIIPEEKQWRNPNTADTIQLGDMDERTFIEAADHGFAAKDYHPDDPCNPEHDWDEGNNG